MTEKQSIKLTFSGHDTFQCRQLWLKKGYEFIKARKSFKDDSAVVDLGVGKNMVSAIFFWMKAFNILDKENNLTDFGIYLLDDEGKDPYLEDIASLWLLHYNLVKSNHASIYYLIFNELRKEKIEFTKENFLSFIKRRSEIAGMANINTNTVSTDFDIFIKMYKLTESQGKDIEDTFSGLLTDLGLLKYETRKGTDRTEVYYYIDNTERLEIPDEVILYGIIAAGGFDKSISFSALQQDINSIGTVFAISRTGLVNKLESIATSKKFKEFKIIYTDQAGVKELQFKNKPSPLEVLNIYYGS